VIENEKSAKKQINNLKKNAKQAKKENNYEKALNILQNAANIATNWDITKDFRELEDTIRLTTIEGLRKKMKLTEDEAKTAVKQKNYSEAAAKYKNASEMASEVFKLGVDEMTKELKRLSNKSKEYEKLA